AELHLRDAGIRVARVDRTPSDDAVGAAARAVGDERLALRVDGQSDAARVAIDDLRPLCGTDGNQRDEGDRDEEGGLHLALKVPATPEASLPRSRDPLETGYRTEMPLVRAFAHDFGNLLDGESELVVGVVVVRAETKPCIRAKVAEDLPFGELLVHGFELGCPH